MDLKISIIVPVYKAEAYLHRCVDSLLAQTFQNYEILLIDDGSPDRSGEICEEYAKKDERIRVFHKANGGVSSARNIGIREATASWITFIDSDDWVEPEYLQSFINCPEIASCDIIIQGILSDYGDYVEPLYSYTTGIIDFADGLAYKEVERAQLFHNGCPVAKLYNTKLIKMNDISFDTRLQMHEDHLFVLSYYQHCKKLGLIAAYKYHYMRLQNQTSLSLRRHSYESLVLASNCFFLHYEAFKKLGLLKEGKYRRNLVTHYGLSQRLRGIINLYYMHVPKIKRRSIIIDEKRMFGKQIGQYFECTTFGRYVFVYSFLYLPVNFFDFLLRSIIK